MLLLFVGINHELRLSKSNLTKDCMYFIGYYDTTNTTNITNNTFLIIEFDLKSV